MADTCNNALNNDAIDLSEDRGSDPESFGGSDYGTDMNWPEPLTTEQENTLLQKADPGYETRLTETVFSLGGYPFKVPVNPPKTISLGVLPQSGIDPGDGEEKFSQAGMSHPGGFAASVAKTVEERAAQYGPPTACHQLTADLWGKWLSRKLGQTIILTAEDVCILMVLLKTVRLADGTHDDSLIDVQGWIENVAYLGTLQRNYK